MIPDEGLTGSKTTLREQPAVDRTAFVRSQTRLNDLVLKKRII